MASSETDSRTNSLTNRSVSSSRGEEEIRPNELKGWLMKRSRLSRKWKKQWFLLKTTDLLYGNSPEVTFGFIFLAIIFLIQRYSNVCQRQEPISLFYVIMLQQLQQNISNKGGPWKHPKTPPNPPPKTSIYHSKPPQITHLQSNTTNLPPQTSQKPGKIAYQ